MTSLWRLHFDVNFFFSVKPSNVLVDLHGNIKLCDFGISGRLVDNQARTRGAGCAAYLSPERIDPEVNLTQRLGSAPLTKPLNGKRKGFRKSRFSKIKKEKGMEIENFFKNRKRKKGKDCFWKPGKERKNADSSSFQQNTNKNTHNHVGCTLMKSFWNNKLCQIKVKFINYIPFQRIVVVLWLLRCSQQLELPLLIRLVAISFYSND